jgi:hypothetical protein
MPENPSENPYLRAAKTPDGKTRLKAQVARIRLKRPKAPKSPQGSNTRSIKP